MFSKTLHWTQQWQGIHQDNTDNVISVRWIFSLIVWLMAALHIVKSRTKCISFFASLRLSGQLRWRDWCKLPNTILTISSPLLFKSDKSTVFMCSVEWHRLAGQGQESGGKVWGIICVFDVCESWPISHH